MPTVGKKQFDYDRVGMAAAVAHAKKTGKKVEFEVKKKKKKKSSRKR